MNAIDGMACATPGCDNRGKPGLNIVGYGSFATKSGRRRRYRCTVCRGTLSTNTGTAYSGLRCTRREFDQVASLRVEGVSISATARVTGHSRNTVARWLERASTAAKHFNDRMLRDFELRRWGQQTESSGRRYGAPVTSGRRALTQRLAAAHPRRENGALVHANWKNGRTHLAHKVWYAVDLETGASWASWSRGRSRRHHDCRGDRHGGG